MMGRMASAAFHAEEDDLGGLAEEKSTRPVSADDVGAVSVRASASLQLRLVIRSVQTVVKANGPGS